MAKQVVLLLLIYSLGIFESDSIHTIIRKSHSWTSKLKLSDSEKLIAIMLSDVSQVNNISGEIDPTFVKEAITGGETISGTTTISAAFA